MEEREGVLRNYLFQVLNSDDQLRNIRICAYSIGEARAAYEAKLEVARKFFQNDFCWSLIRVYEEYIPEAEEE